MKRKLSILLSLILVCLCAVVFTVIALAEGEEEQSTITISYMKAQDSTSDTTKLDTVAYTDGKQTVALGESFTLPTTADSSYAGKNGFQLVWYTVDGRTYKAGEEVSFDKDTKLFRCVAKECYSITEVNYAMKNESKAAILMADIDSTTSVNVENQGQSVLILNGFTLNITRNGNAMGDQRSGKHIYGTGTINITNPDGKLGSYAVFDMKSHGYNGHLNKQVIGRDVVVNAPNFWVGADSDGSYNNHYPWLRIYGTVNCYGFISIGNTGNRAPFVEVFDTATVTVNGPSLFKDNAWRANNKYSFNSQAFELRIYGGTFNLPAEAATQSFWTNDYVESYVNGSTSYFNHGLDKNTADVIKIFGGTFTVEGGEAPAIADYLTADFIGSIPSGGNGLWENKNTSTYHVCYMNRPGYSLAFDKYTEGTPAKLTVIDYVDGSLSGTYYYTATKDPIVKPDYDGTERTYSSFSDIVIYEGREVTAEDGSTSMVYDVVTKRFSVVYAMGGALKFSNEITQKDYKLQANGSSYIVAPAGCEHTYEETVVESSCLTQGSVTYTCTLCGYSTTTVTEERGQHSYDVVNDVAATETSLGAKTLKCKECGETIERVYTIDPTSLEISVTLRKDDDTFEDVTVLASEVFEFTTSGVEGAYIYTLSGIKAFGDYKVRNIYGITIPKGIMYVNITTHNYEKYNNVEYGLVNLTISDGAKVNILNIGNLRKVETIKVGASSDVTFAASCSWYSPNNERRNMQKITTIDLSAGNHNVVFMNSAFQDITFTKLLLGENSTYEFASYAFHNCSITEFNIPASNEYTFGSYSFYGNDMTELVFPDNKDITLAQSTFEKCTALTSVKFGENSVYSIGNYAFTYCPIARVTLTQNSEYTIGNKAFINEALTALDMSAGNITVTLEDYAFQCWLNNKLYCSLSEVKFGENSTYKFNKHSLNDAIITSLTLAPNSSYTFGYRVIDDAVSKTAFKSIDASADNITVKFEGECFRERTGLTTLLINGKNSNYSFSATSFYNTAITELTLGEGSTYVFDNCFNGSTPIASVDASADNLDVTFKTGVFNGKTALTTLLINGKNGNYYFAGDSFKNTAVKELELGEGSTYNFVNSAFNGVSTLEKLDAGANNVTVTFNDYIFNGKSKLSVLDISGENSTYTFGRESFKNTIVEELRFGSGSTYTFGYKVFDGNAALKTLDFTASNVTATFNQEAFTGRTSVTYLAFGENSTYDIVKFAFNKVKAVNDIVFDNTSSFKIGEKAFYESSFASITFEDDVDVTFTGNQSFQYSTSVKLYLGKNFKLDCIPFQDMKYLEKLVIMEGVAFKDGAEDYFFSQSGAQDFATPFVVYNHSTDITFSQRMFNNCDGIVLYTITDNIGDRNDVFNNCSDGNGYKGWTVVLGIPHVLTEGQAEPSCTIPGGTIWIAADCDCGIVYREELNINVYENKYNIKEDTAVARTDVYAISPIAPNGHTKGEFVTIVYANGYLSDGCAQYNCTVCNNEEGYYEEAANPIFVCRGYSVCTFDGSMSMSQGFSINASALDAYQAVVPSFAYGIVASINLSGEAKQPLEAVDGKVNKVDTVTMLQHFDKNVINYLDVKITGISSATADTSLILCIYVFDGETIQYIDNGQALDSVVGTTYNLNAQIEK